MTRDEFRGFLSALRAVMQSRREGPADLEISESLDSAALPMPDGSRKARKPGGGSGPSM
jgi:hypothetical protein